MKDNVKIAAGAALVVTAVVLSIKEYRMIHRVPSEVRAKIKAETDAQIKAIHHARDTIIKRIDEGQYNERGVAAVFNDFKFETIIARIEEE